MINILAETLNIMEILFDYAGFNLWEILGEHRKYVI